MTYPIYGGPITQSAVSDLQQNFQWMYGMCNPFQNLPLVCNWPNFMAQLGIGPGWATDNGKGVLFYYMLETDGVTPYFSYAIINAERAADGSFQPTPGATYFSVLPNSGGIKTYTTPAELLFMNQCIANYESLVLTRNTPDIIAGTTVAVSSLLNHPKRAFYSAETVWKFYEDNNAQISGTTDICVCHGAEYTDITAGPPDNQYKTQTPVVVFQNGNTKLLSDDSPDANKLFMDKAMENGAKCPPKCA